MPGKAGSCRRIDYLKDYASVPELENGVVAFPINLVFDALTYVTMELSGFRHDFRNDRET